MPKPRAIRRIILEQSKRAHVGHIGSALSIADIISSLYFEFLRVPSPADPERDRFVLSKGHAVLALYAALHLKGWISAETLSTYCADRSLLGCHPEHQLPGIELSTGSLGMGLSMGAGLALAGRYKRQDYRTVVLISDAECNEGSVWECAMFAAHHRLSSLVAVLDLNGQQAFGYTSEVLRCDNMKERWRAFGWDVREVDGHDETQIGAALAGMNFESGPPHLLLARTTFGKGVSFMHNQICWHYLPMSDQQYEQALEEVMAS